MKKLLLFPFISLGLFGQTQSKVSPDCTLGPGAVNFTTTGNSVAFDNRPVSQATGIPCTNWTLEYSAQPAVTSLTIQIQAAPDNGGVPGSFSSIASSTVFPSGKLNISTSTGYYPWMRVSVTAIGTAGSITGVLNGWRENAATIGGGGGGGGGCSSPCVVIGPTPVGSPSGNAPVQISELDGSGNLLIPTLGTKSAPINLSSVSGENQIIALSGSTVIRIAHISVGMTTNVTVSIDVGTGTNCASGTTTIWGPFPANTTGFSLDLEPSMLKAPAGDAICLNFGGTVTAGGGVTFSQY